MITDSEIQKAIETSLGGDNRCRLYITEDGKLSCKLFKLNLSEIETKINILPNIKLISTFSSFKEVIGFEAKISRRSNGDLGVRLKKIKAK